VARGRRLLSASASPGDEGLPCAVLFPDLVHLPDQTALRCLVRAYSSCGAALFGLRVTTEGELFGRTAAVELAEPLLSPAAFAEARASGRPLRITAVRPASGAPGEIVTTFAQIETPAFAAAVEAHCRTSAGLLDDRGLLRALGALAEAGALYGVLLPGEIIDLGTLPGYLAAARRFFGGDARLREVS
jgi:UTP-glucose-1-phosphate uridylyltransferase